VVARRRPDRLWVLREIAKDCRHLLGGVDALRRILRQQVYHEVRQPLRDGWVDLARWGGLVHDHRQQRRHTIGALEWLPACTELVEHDAEAEQVAAGIEHVAARLLGGHVCRSADDRTFLRQAGALVGGPCQAEVEDLDTLLRRFQPDVGRFDVAVDHSGGVGDAEPGGDLSANPQHLGDGQLPLALQAAIEGLAFEEGHDNEGSATLLADLQDRHDVIVLQRCRGTGLTKEALVGAGIASQVWQHGLDGHLAA
jgi:hypothetical protein